MPDASIFSRQLPGIRWVEVRVRDTMQSIALRELGDAARWTELVAVNGLRHPYIANTAAAGVVTPGGLVKVPATSGYVSSDVDPAAVFRADVLLQNGKMQAEGGDFAIAAGVGNLSQALGIRLRVDQRELLFHPEYGCRAARLVGMQGGEAVAMLAGQYVKSALLADDRVSSVVRAQAALSGDRVSVDAAVEAVGGVVVEVQGAI